MSLFETERLIVRQLSRQDLPALTGLLGDPEVMKYSVRGACDENAVRRFIDWTLNCYASRGVGLWALLEKGSNDFVGFCGLAMEMIDGIEEINLGYRLAKRYWNRGLASEAARAALEYVFDRREVASVVVVIDPEHTASLKVAEKLGFQNFHETDFHGRPVRLYRMTHGQWHESRQRTIRAASS